MGFHILRLPRFDKFPRFSFFCDYVLHFFWLAFRLLFGQNNQYQDDTSDKMCRAFFWSANNTEGVPYGTGAHAFLLLDKHLYPSCFSQTTLEINDDMHADKQLRPHKGTHTHNHTDIHT